MGSRAVKEQVVSELREKLENSESVILADYRGLNVAEMTELRAKLREVGVEFSVVKNTLTWIAAKDLGLEDLEEHLKGPTALAFGLEDAIAPAKELVKFAKDHKKLELKAGVLSGKVISADEVKALADMPSREELLSKTLGAFMSPMTSFASVLNALPRNLVYVVEAIREKKEAEAS